MSIGVQQDVWERLLAGNISRVYVFGWPDRRAESVIGRYLPQTLGLEPVVCDAYRYDSGGMARTIPQWADVAERLAEGEHWIAEGTPPFWSVPFMKRAEAVISFDTLASRLEHPRVSVDNGPIPALASTWRWLVGPSAGTVPVISPSTSNRWPGDAVDTLQRIAAAQFPDKFVRVTSRRQVRQLRAVRASQWI